MSVKSDRWIRRMAAEHDMIEPFEPGQVRSVDGRRIISYGTSSYGYDIRCADEFKIFTNINSSIVDPKAFDARSFVDLQADVCIIPPNSFALARTVEYFRIPRDVLVVCLGKSTYARCFRGDTRVALVDGTAPTLEEMAERAEDGELFWGYSIGEFGRVIVTLLDAPRFIGRDALLEVTLDNRETIHCTPDHEFLRRDGRLAQAHELRTGDSLMPLYRQLARGYEVVYQPLNGHLYPTHRLADEWNDRNGMPLARDGIEVQNTGMRLGDFRASSSPLPRGRLGGGGLAVPTRLETPSVSPPCEGGEPWNRARMVNDDPRIALEQDFTALRNHKITGIRELPGDHDVYCLTVPEAGNFALEAGVFVRNCGIIVNVTPLEPEWEGHVTLEFSNTTPLPARIYANEGVAQVLFLGADEVCETSYKDRSGKYMGQRGVTLPKT